MPLYEYSAKKKKKPLYELLGNLKKTRIGYKKLICMCHSIMSYIIVGDVYQKKFHQLIIYGVTIICPKSCPKLGDESKIRPVMVAGMPPIMGHHGHNDGNG